MQGLGGYVATLNGNLLSLDIYEENEYIAGSFNMFNSSNPE
jgi:hypothetical protein